MSNRGGLTYQQETVLKYAKEPVAETADGLKFLNRGPHTDDHLALGGHETALGPILQSLCDPNRAYLNVGAHVGTWALRLTAHVSKVYAVEANRETAHVLEYNCLLNDLSEKVLICVAALWDNENDLVVLTDVNGKDTGGSTRVSTPEKDAAGRIRTSRLDGFSISPIGLISMDVEGAEARVLRGAKETIARDRPNMVIELHEGHPGVDADIRAQVYSVLDELDYEYGSVFVALPEEHLICYPREKRFAEPETVKYSPL